ncbi:MAG: DNA topoisomerase I [Candidatus Micrarchaeia archaeon]
MGKLIIAEKPSVALRIAIALGEGKQRRELVNGVSYFVIGGNDTIYVASAVGHIFTIHQAGSAHGYPVLDVEWVPSYKASPVMAYTKKYFDVFEMLSKKCDTFVNACDYDTEGTVIGTNIINFIAHGLGRAKRMKFSTTTTADLKEAFANLGPLDITNFYAGETRHILDWLWGINLSRALSSAMGNGKPLSIGRVQGPTLALLASRELEIKAFVPKPYWTIEAIIEGAKFSNKRGEIFDKNEAETAYKETLANKDKAKIESIEKKEEFVSPYPPFDLTSLQLEASRVYHVDPSTTLAIAQSLYERSYISYPRTSSQRLPPTIGLAHIIEELAKNPAYSKSAEMLIREKRFKPHEGQKTDEAHPAIYPTGIVPKSLNANEQKIYDLVVKRFLACFAPYSKVARTKVIARAGPEQYVASGSVLLEKGWLDIYGFVDPKENILPDFKEGPVSIDKVDMSEQATKPPRRYTKASLIAELERRKLGTKATRAAIIDTLFKRGYISGGSIAVTNFGMSIYNALKKYAEMIIKEDTTRKLEEDMEKIASGEKKQAEVIEEGKALLLEALKAFDANKKGIGIDMAKGLEESEVVLGTCPIDGGKLIIRHSKGGKIFAGCSNYPNCKAIYPLPQHAKIVPTGKVCEYCHTPIVKIFRGGKVFEMDLDPQCVTKKNWITAKELKEKEELEAKGQKPKTEKAKQEKPKQKAPKRTKAKQPKQAKKGAKVQKPGKKVVEDGR